MLPALTSRAPLSQHTRAYTQCSPTLNHLQVMDLSHPAIDTHIVALFLPFRFSLRARQTRRSRSFRLRRAHGPQPRAARRLPRTSNILIHILPVRLSKTDHRVFERAQEEEARATVDLFHSCEHLWERLITSGLRSSHSKTLVVGILWSLYVTMDQTVTLLTGLSARVSAPTGSQCREPAHPTSRNLTRLRVHFLVLSQCIVLVL